MSQSAQTSRRDFLRGSLLSTAIFGAGPALSAAETRKAAANAGSARNVIFMVSDGMNHGALSLTNQFLHLTRQESSHWMRLYRERPVVRCLMETFSANSCVTDSAAAATAWGAGQRCNNGSINVAPDDKDLTPMHAKLQKAGRRTGLVSTATITHATPAGFAANVKSRADEGIIAKQYLDRKVDVLLGGGQKFFSPELRASYQKEGYDLVLNRRDMKRLKNKALKPLLGIFSDSHIPFDIDRKNVAQLGESLPTLAEMTQTALDRLSHAADGFFLMVEGARIDHAGHANDAAASIHDQIAFDEAISTVLAFLEKEPDTLVIITTDHGCGGIQMNGVSADPNQGIAPGLYNFSSQSFERLTGFTRSIEWMKQNGVDGLSGKKLGIGLKQFTGLELTSEQIKSAQGLKAGVTEVIKAHTGIGWTSGNHTGELVEFCALGAGSHLFPAFMQNKEVHDLLLRAMDIA